MSVAYDLGVGAVVADYQVESVLGRGGMSTVYLARDLRLRRRVALKVLSSALADDERFRERFLRESEMAASIDHPHIVPIYQSGDAGGVLYIAMRYVAGGDLRSRLRSGRLELVEATTILAQVAQALDTAHSLGLVHRDVKPSNILLDPGTGPDGADHAYLSDFGITTRIADQGQAPGEGSPLGTIEYVAPEQIGGGDVDGRADVYSLGCVLFECLVGEPPFHRDTDVQVVFAHLDAEPPSISARRKDLPGALDAVIDRALAKDPGERFAQCRDLTGAALEVAIAEAGRQVAVLTGQAAAGRHRLHEVEDALAERVVELQTVRERVRDLADVTEPVRRVDGSGCPFMGLAGFRTADSDLFFGRERLVADMVARLAGSTFLGVLGPSGSGKSSVLRAGLIPALASGVLPGSETWRPVLIRPGDRPPAQLYRILAEATDQRLLIVVDQLEEMFTAYESPEELAAFADVLAWGPARGMVVAMRADFYGRLASFPALADRFGADHVLVGPMRESELRRAVEGPAGRVGLRIDPELVGRLVDDVAGEPGALPLLSTTLVELWQRRRNDTLSLDSYLKSGGVRGAIARLAESTYATVPAEHRPQVRAILLRLVGETGTEAAVRRRAALTEFDRSRPEVAAVLSTLVDGRLLTMSDDGVELAHEALLREWPRLRGWLDQDADGRRLRRHLTDAALDWDRSGRDSSMLFRGARLAATLDWSADHDVELNSLEREFLDAGHGASQQEARSVRRTNKRLRGLLIAAAVLLVAALVGGTLAVIQRGEAQVAATAAAEAETAQFAQRLGAQALVEQDLDLALLLARQAVAVRDTPQTRGSLLAVLGSAPAAVGIMHGDGDADLRDMALSPDGSTLAVLDFFGKIHFFDARTFQPVGEPLVTSGWVERLAYSPDGRTLAFGTGQMTDGVGFLRLVDAQTREPLGQTIYHYAEMKEMAFSADGSRLLVAATSAGLPLVSIHDAGTMRLLGRPIQPWASLCQPGAVCPIPHMALTPDGEVLITAGEGELAWWDLTSGQKIRTLPLEPGDHPLALSPDGRLAALGMPGGIRVIDLDTGEGATGTGNLAGQPNHLVFASDGASLASSNRDGTVTVWDVTTMTPRQTLRGHASDVTKSEFGADDTTLFSVSGDGTAIAWDLSGTNAIRRSFTVSGVPGSPPSDGPVHPGVFSPDGSLIAVGLKGDGIGLWSATDLTPAGATLVGTGGEVSALAFSPDGHTLAAAAGGSAVTVWDVATRTLRYPPMRAVWGFVPGLAFSPDGSTLITAGLLGVQTWDVESGTESGGATRTPAAQGLSLSADGALAAITTMDGAEVWNIGANSRVAVLPGDVDADEYSTALSPDGRTVAVGGFGRFVRLWDVASRALRQELDLVGGSSLTIEFSPDGSFLATAGALWDVATGTRIGPTLARSSGQGHEFENKLMMDVSPDGHRLLLSERDGLITVWDIDPVSWAQRACALANRTLTPVEWDRFLPGRPYEPACEQ